jgi:hypothetical protein
MPKYVESKHSARPDQDRISATWWREEPREMARALTSLMEALRTEQGARDRANLIYYSMFAGVGLSGLKGNKYARRKPNTGTLRLNLSRAIASAANSKIAKNKPRIIALTEGGNWSQMTRAKKWTKAINGTFHAIRLYEHMQRAQLDSCVVDLGAVKFFRRGKKVCAERVFGPELRVDDAEGRYGAPRSLYHTKTVAREKLLADFGDDANAKKLIRKAPRADGAAFESGRWQADVVEVTEAWHLPSGESAGDGVRALCVKDGTLGRPDEWAHEYFPFVFQIWEQMPLGFLGQSISAQTVGIQHAINKALQDIEEHNSLSTGYVAIEKNSKISKAAFTNDVWRLIEYVGTAPQYISPSAVPPEKLAYLQFLVQRGYEEAGLSQLSVNSKKPAGLDAAVALREFNDIESERFQMTAQRYEQSYVDAAHIISDLYEEIYEDEGELTVYAPDGSKLLDAIDWEKARMDRDDFVARVVPTSFLPSTPSAKLQTIQEMIQGGLLSREEGMMLLDFPDLEQVSNMRNAPLRNLLWRIETILDPDADPGKQAMAATPEPFTLHKLALDLSRSAYNDAQANGAPEANLETLRRFMVRCESELAKQAAPPPAPPQIAPPMSPPALPAPPVAA